MDHPVLAAGLKENVAALQSLPVKGDHHLAIRPLDGLVGSFVPDQHLAPAVLALRYLAGELEVFERVVLDVDRQVVLLGVGRDALGDRPRNTDAVFLEPEVPVEPPGVVLLDHKPRRLGLGARDLGAGFGCALEIAFGLVIGELFGHHQEG